MERVMIYVKTSITSLLAAGGLFLLAGCTSTRLPVDRAVEDQLDRLNRSAIENRMARISLVRMGERAVPHIVQRLDVPEHSLRRGQSAIQAARLLRVLREMKSPAVLPVCDRILLKYYIRPASKEGAAVLNEAIGCVYALFPRQEACDIYYTFVTGDARQYLKEQVDVQHWGAGGKTERLAVDVLTGFSLMVNAGDQRIQAALTAFLQNISGGSLQHMYFHQLAENGFSETALTTSKDRTELERMVKPKD